MKLDGMRLKGLVLSIDFDFLFNLRVKTKKKEKWNILDLNNI